MSSITGGKKGKKEKDKGKGGQPTHQHLMELRKRVELCQRETSYKNEVMRLQDAITRAEQESWKIKEEVEKFKNSRDFEWQLEKYSVVRTLTAQIAVDQEDLVFAQDKYDILHKEVMEKYPELGNDFLKQQEVPPEELAETELEQDFNHIDLNGTGADTGPAASSISFGDTASEVVYSWIIGKLSHDGKISTVLYGQFTKSKLPPKEGWVFVGKNLDRNVVAINKDPTASEAAAAANAHANTDDTESFASNLSPKGANMSQVGGGFSRKESLEASLGGDSSTVVNAPASVVDVPPAETLEAGDDNEDGGARESNSNKFKRVKLLPESVLEQARGDSVKVVLHTHVMSAPAPVVSPGGTVQDTLEGAATALALAAIPEMGEGEGEGLGLGLPVNIVSLEESKAKAEAEAEAKANGGIFSEHAPPDSAVSVTMGANAVTQSPLRSGAISPTTLSMNTDPSSYVYYISGCSLDMLNGRYLPQGSMFNAPK